jgi:uncharacterized radical SAM superfamily Fe-S cluster-containing enzyme
MIPEKSMLVEQSKSVEVIDFTKSLCPECRDVIKARIVVNAGQVHLHKHCPKHGRFEALLFGDAALYRQIEGYDKPGRSPLEFATAVENGCPHDCGLCPDHKQHACVGVIEINSACNLDCPVCCADAGTHLAHSGFRLNHEQVDFMLDRFVAAEGEPEVIQFSGGEPTLHSGLFDFIELAQEKGIEYVMVNSNGLRIARDDRFLAVLSRLKPHIYLQFDGFDEEASFILRGRRNLISQKLRALDRLAEADVRVVLVAAIEHGVNESQIGPIVDFGLRHPAVFGVNFQPVFRAQRHLPADPLTRITIPDVIKAIEQQTQGLFRLSDFVPVSCCAPTCHFVTYAILNGDAVAPVPRLVDIDKHHHYFENRTIPGLNDDLVKLLERLWRAPALSGNGRFAGGLRRALIGDSQELEALLAGARQSMNGGRTSRRCMACKSHLPLSKHSPRDIGRHIFMISIRDFMDPWTFDVRDVMKCCVDFIVPDGRIIPFCTYNTLGYREQVAQSLLKQGQIDDARRSPARGIAR